MALELKRAKASTPFGGQARIPSTVPLAAKSLGPSTAAPASTGGEPSSEPTRLVTWCCMQLGKVLPSPTISEVPQALAPRMLASQRFASTAAVRLPVSAWYSLASTDRPAPCEV